MPTSAEELLAEICGRFDFAAGRGDRPIVVRAFNPTTDGRRLRARRARCVETNTEDSRSSSTPCARRARRAQGLTVQRVMHPVVGTGARRRDGAITGVRPRRARRRARESVMHFELDRRLERRGAGGARRRASARCSATCAGRWCDFPAMADRGRRDGGARRRGRRALRRTTRSTRPSRSSSGCSPATSSSSATASTRSRTTRSAVVPGSGLGILRRRGVARPSRGRGRWPSCRRTCASARSRATC